MKTVFVILGIAVVGIVGYTVWSYQRAPAPAPIVRPMPAPAAVVTTQPASTTLSAKGIGDTSFGTPANDVMNTLTILFGAPSKDTGSIESFSAYGTCPGQTIRVVEWGRLRVFFGDTVFGKNAFFHYEYTDRDSSAMTPVLAMNQDITLGSSESALKAAYPHAIVTPFEEGGWSSFVISSDQKTGASFGGNLGDTHKIYWINAGIACGE